MKRYEKNWGQTGEHNQRRSTTTEFSQSSNTRRRSRSRDRERSDNRRVYVEEERKRREEYYQTHDDLGRDINQYSQHSTQNTRDMSTGGRLDQSTTVPIKVVDEVNEIKVDESKSISQLQISTESFAIPEGKETDEGEVDLFDDEAIAAALGFTSFGSTKGSAIEDNQVGPARGAVAKGVPKKVYRQYMHRATGFAHALDPQAPSKRK
jgi:hypothetical protein